MSDTTLNKYIHLLSSAQQEMIVFCVQKFGDRPDLHRGLLPFLKAQEAADCINMQLETVKAAQALPPDEGGSKAVVGERFLRQIISVFNSALIYKSDDATTTEVIYLESKKIKKRYGPRYHVKFCLSLEEFGVQMKKPIKGLVELQMISRNRWKITAHSDYIGAVVMHLQDEYGYYPQYSGI